MIAQVSILLALSSGTKILQSVKLAGSIDAHMADFQAVGAHFPASIKPAFLYIRVSIWRICGRPVVGCFGLFWQISTWLQELEIYTLSRCVLPQEKSYGRLQGPKNPLITRTDHSHPRDPKVLRRALKPSSLSCCVPTPFLKSRT